MKNVDETQNVKIYEKYSQFAQDEKTVDDKNEEGSSQIKKSIYRNINCEDCGKAFENLDIQEKRIIEEYDTENIKTYLRRSKLRRLTKIKDEKTEIENNHEKE